MSSVINVSDTSTTENVTYYHITVKLPLRTLTVLRRYSEFSDLVTELCFKLGIDVSDFPYQLPPKSSLWTKNSGSVIEQRKQGLSEFLQQLITDRELQNDKLVHSFLQLPTKFKFTPAQFRGDNDGDLIISDVNSVDSMKFLELLRVFKATNNDLMQQFNSSSDNVTIKFSIRDKLHRIVFPNLDKLIQALEHLLHNEDITNEEYQRRKLLVQELKAELQSLDDVISHRTDKKHHEPSSFTGKRVFGKSQETPETLPLDNQQLLQQQIDIHKQQDQELGELRKIIQRQREIGLTINQETEEQNELLDSFNEDVDHTTEKLRLARHKARKVL